MIPYLIILFVAWWLSAMVERKQDAGNLDAARKYKILLMTALTCFIGFRYFVGADYGAYIHDYGKFLQKNYGQILLGSDPGFVFFTKLFSLVYNSPTTMFFTAAAVFVVLCIHTLDKHSEYFSLSVLFFILCGTYLESCNAVRQCVAVAIVISGYGFICDRHLLKYFLLVLLASAFHSSAIVMLPLYFILSCPPKLKKIYWLMMIAGAIILSYKGLFSVAEMVIQKPINFEEKYFTTSVNLLRVAVAVAPCILIPFLKKEMNEKLTLSTNLVLLNAVLMCITSNSAYLARVGIYSTAFLCLALPQLLYNLRVRKESIPGLKLTMLACYAVFWMYGILHSAGLYPYQTIFNAVK